MFTARKKGKKGKGNEDIAFTSNHQNKLLTEDLNDATCMTFNEEQSSITNRNTTATEVMYCKNYCKNYQKRNPEFYITITIMISIKS